MTENKNTLNFKILNTNISVMAGDDADHVRDIAFDVSELLEGIRSKNPISNHVQVAVIGCMNLAEELRELKAENSELKRLLSESRKNNDFLSGRLQEKKVEVNQLEKSLEEQSQTVSDLEKNMADQESDLQNQIADKENQLAQISEQ